MSDYTEHYNLKKPLKTENYDVDVANTNNDIIDEKIYNKVDKISGKDLSTNDFTNEYKKKIDRIIEGTKGDSAYQIAVKNGFEGTEEKWLESLKGDKGDKGELVDLIKEEEGKNISIESANLPAIEVSIEGESRQETRSGKNRANLTRDTFTNNGVTFTNNGDGTYTLNGTATAGMDNNLLLTEKHFEVSPNNFYRLSIKEFNGSMSGNGFALANLKIGEKITWGWIGSTTHAKKPEAIGTIVMINYYIGQGAIFNNYKIGIQMEVVDSATAGASSWEPYGASPSPDNLSKIENLEGKNKFNKKTDYLQLYMDTTSIIQSENEYIGYIKCNPNTYYSISKAITYAQGFYVGCTEVLPSHGVNIINGIQSSSATKCENYKTPSNVKYLVFRIGPEGNGITLQQILDSIQVEEGPIATNYVPYNSLEIKDVGKNLYAGNEITINGTYSSNTSVNLGSRYLSEGNYTISLTNSLPNNSYIYLGANGSIATAIRNKATFTLTEEQNVPMRLVVKAGTYSNFTTKIMIEKGMVVTDYEPHQQQTEYFPLSEGQKLYKNSYLADDGTHHKRKQVVLDGTETGWYTLANQTGTNTSYFAIAKSDMKKASILICDKFINRATWNTDEEGIQSIIDNYIRLRINTSRASTVAELKTWLSNNPIRVEYELAKEEIVPYTDGQKEAREKIKNMILYKGTNHISCTGKLKIKYYTNEEMNEIYAKKEDLHEHANKSILDQTQEAFTTELKNKLDGLNNYVLPAPTSASLGGVKAGSNITIDADGTINAQLGSSGETSANNYEVLSNKPQIAGITLQGNKSLADLGIQGVETGKGLSSNDYTTKEKAKLAGVEEQANKYIHPNTSGNKHVPSGGSSGQVLKWKSDGTAQWDNLSSSGELGTDDLNSKKINGIYAQSTATNFLKSRNYPFDHADGFPFFDILLEVKNAGMYIMQELHLSYKISVQGQEVISYFTYMRFSTNNGSTWSAWRGHEGTTTQ